MALTSDVLASIRAAVDRDGTDVQVLDTTLLLWANEEFSVLARRVAGIIPDRYLKLTADFAGAASTDLSSSLATDFSRLRAVQVKVGIDYFDLPPAPVINPELTSSGGAGWCYRLRGRATLDLYPTTTVVGQTFRVKYLYKPAALSGVVAVDLPDGGETVIVETVAARCRGRWEEDPGLHLQTRQARWVEFRDSLTPYYQTAPQVIVDVTGRY